jgi:hypothetical protein
MRDGYEEFAEMAKDVLKAVAKLLQSHLFLNLIALRTSAGAHPGVPSACTWV